MNLCTFMGEAAYPTEYIGDEDEDDIFIFCLEGEKVIREGNENSICTVTGRVLISSVSEF